MKLPELVKITLVDESEYTKLYIDGKPYLGYLVGRVMQRQQAMDMYYSAREVQAEILNQIASYRAK